MSIYFYKVAIVWEVDNTNVEDKSINYGVLSENTWILQNNYLFFNENISYTWAINVSLIINHIVHYYTVRIQDDISSIN